MEVENDLGMEVEGNHKRKRVLNGILPPASKYINEFEEYVTW